MRQAGVSLLLGLLLGGGPAAFAADQSLRQCTKTFRVGPVGKTIISSKPAKICSMECRASAANGWAAAWDSPDGTELHGQAVVHAEPAAATAGNMGATGPIDRYTNFGLMVEAVNCYATGSYVD